MDTSFSKWDRGGGDLPIGNTWCTMESEYNINCEIFRLYGGHTVMHYLKKINPQFSLFTAVNNDAQ